MGGRVSSAQGWQGRAFRHERQRHAVVAVALAGGARPVVEHVALVPATARAVVFGAREDELEVGGRTHRIGQRLPETGPAGAAVVLVGGTEQRLVAGGTHEGARALFTIQRAGTGWFGAVFEQHMVGSGRNDPLPLG